MQNGNAKWDMQNANDEASSTFHLGRRGDNILHFSFSSPYCKRSIFAHGARIS
jgi:hypothetical protein